MIVDEVTEPTLDGTRGSGLYRVPFRLSREPTDVWAEAFVRAWNSPPSFTSMHRPGIARVEGAKIVLDGTTVPEVRDYHRETLVQCVSEANNVESESLARRKGEIELRRQRQRRHRDEVESIAGDLSFD